jgi:hypothetical protein
MKINAHWQRHVEAWRESGLSQATYCHQQGLKRIQAQFNVAVARIVMELNGIPCLELEEIAPDKQQIVSSRCFSRRLTIVFLFQNNGHPVMYGLHLFIGCGGNEGARTNRLTALLPMFP